MKIFPITCCLGFLLTKVISLQKQPLLIIDVSEHGSIDVVYLLEYEGELTAIGDGYVSAQP